VPTLTLAIRSGCVTAEQGGGGSDVRRDDVRRTETGVGSELGKESARTFPIDEGVRLWGRLGSGSSSPLAFPPGPAVVVTVRVWDAWRL
jgi:hypothetical protein